MTGLAERFYFCFGRLNVGLDHLAFVNGVANQIPIEVPILPVLNR